MEHYLLPAGAGALSTGCVLDLGCGSGRDTVYMAQRLPPGTRVIGVDNHSYALERGRGLARDWLNAETHGVLEGNNGRQVVSVEGGGEDEPSVPSTDAMESTCPQGQGDVGGRKDRTRRCEWLLADLRKAGSLDGFRASVIHGHRFKCEQLLPVLRDEVSRGQAR